MKQILSIALLVFLAMPAVAQEAVKSEDIPPEATAPSKSSLELAQKMHEIWPIRTRMETALESISDGFPEERRAEILATMRKSIQYDALEEESIKAMAEIFTADELKAMIEFYGSEHGRSISIKTGDYEAAIRPVLVKMMDKAVMDLKLGAPQ